MRNYHKRRNTSAIRFKDILRANKKQLLTLGATVAAVIVVIAVITGVAARQEFDASFLVTGDTVKIGIRTDVKDFGQVDESGEITGFDRDFIDEVMRRMLEGQEKLYEYVPITSQNAGASIKYGYTNVNLGLLVDGTDRTKGFRVTKPYYLDRVVAVVHGGSRIDKLTNMEGGRIGMLTMAINMDDLEKYLKKNKIETEGLLRYSDYESAMTDVEHNRVGAIVMPYAIAKQFEAAGFRILAEPLFDVGYSVMLPTGQVAFTNEMNKVIDEMEQDGAMAELRQKWGLQ